ncbi:hypothetical protein [Promicromonospora sp. NPDC019610]|uniref:hypothetical protein n=1 Tax=Promicromonospora sp. NPDC019610 TaxID=3364405 RepID=UPI0037963846
MKMRRIMGMALGLVLTTTIGLTTAAPASAWTYEAKHCVGDLVDRCVSLRRNSDGTVYARASGRDDKDRPGDYSVRMLQVSYSYVRDGNPPAGTTVVTYGDAGWNETYEWIATRALPVPCGTSVGASAKVEWMDERTKERTTGWVSTSAVIC